MFQDSAVALLMLALVGTYAQPQLGDIDIISSNPTVLTEKIPPFVLPEASDNLEVYALPVGQGDCTIIQCPNGNLVVNDCGSSGDNRLTAKGVKAFLGNRIGKVVAIIISHSDQDHFEYLYNIAWTTTNIQQVIIGETLEAYKWKNKGKIYKWLNDFKKAEKLVVVNNGESCIGTCTVLGNFCSDPNIKFDILAANVGKTSNEKSIVMKINSAKVYFNSNILLSGDMEGDASIKIANKLNNGQLKSTIYKMSHHGASDKANKDEWLKPIAPWMAFVSSGYNFGNCRHPRCTTINRLLSLHPFFFAPPHTIYCCSDDKTEAPTQIAGFEKHIHETTPTPNMICLLKYTLATIASFTSKCLDLYRLV